MNIRTFKSDKQALIDEGKRLVSLTDCLTVPLLLRLAPLVAKPPERFPTG